MKLRLPKRRTLLLSLLAVLLIGGGALVYKQVFREDIPPSEPLPPLLDDINYEPATEEEKAQSERRKDEITQEQNQTGNANTSQKKSVTPVVTTANQNGEQITVGGYVPGIFEEGGTCTFTLTKGSHKITKTSQAFASATTTDCRIVTIDRSEFAEAGTWSVVISYSSNAAEGASQPKTFPVN